MKDIIYNIFKKNINSTQKSVLSKEETFKILILAFPIKTLCFSHVTSFQGCRVTVWSYILKMSASEGSESDCRYSFSSCSE